MLSAFAEQIFTSLTAGGGMPGLRWTWAVPNKQWGWSSLILYLRRWRIRLRPD